MAAITPQAEAVRATLLQNGPDRFAAGEPLVMTRMIDQPELFAKVVDGFLAP